MAATRFQRFAALAEVLTMLVLGNFAGLALYELLAPESVAAGTASPSLTAAWEGILIFLRIGIAGVLGFSLLYYRRGLTPQQAGLTRNHKPLAELLSKGLLLGVVTTLPISLLFAARSLIPFGEGLDAWWTYDEQEISLAFWISVLGTSVLIPPLVEEIFTRGYQRARLVESYGAMSGVLLTGLVFALSHTRYLAADPMLLMFFATLVFSSMCWTYVTQKTGSVIPAMVAHALTNGTATLILFEVWSPLIVLLLIVFYCRRPVLDAVVEFVDEWKGDPGKSALWGLLALALVFVPALALLPYLGRLATLGSVGAVLLVITLLNLVNERRRRN